MTPRRNDPRFGPDGPSTSPEPDRGAAGGPEGAAPRDGEDGPERADRDRLAREEAEDAEFDAAIKAIVSSGLIAGPDPGVVEEIRAGGDARREDSPEGEGLGGRSGAPAGDRPAGEAEGAGPNQEALDAARLLALDEKVEEIYRAILTRAPEHKVQPTLQRVRDVLEMMGDPQRSYRAIHITGTNGKTSTSRMVEALLRERGLRTGRFTSPHLESVRERICIDGRAISREGFIAAWEEVEPFIDLVDAASQASGGPRLSFFEVFTVMAYAAFSDAPVDVAIVEVGMGGVWDATNVLDADVAVIGPVALDHERWLGSTLQDIASEKLGIVKPGCTVVCAAQPVAVAEMVRERAAELGARLVESGPDLRVVSRETAVGGQLVTVRTPAARYEDVPLSLRGAFQADNAAVALAAAEALFGGAALGGDVVEHALMSVASPGRLETVRTSPAVLVDAAHNPHGASALADALIEYYPGRLVGVVAMMADKDAEAFLGELEPVLEAVVVTGMSGERAMDAEELAGIARDVFGRDRVEVERDLLAAIDRAATLAEEDDDAPMTSPAVVVTGSIQLVGAARSLMGRPAPDGA